MGAMHWFMSHEPNLPKKKAAVASEFLIDFEIANGIVCGYCTRVE